MVSQDYSTRANDVYVIIGNAALMKCEIPSFVADVVTVYSWVNHQSAEEYYVQNTSKGTFYISKEVTTSEAIRDTQRNNTYVLSWGLSLTITLTYLSNLKVRES